MEKHVIGELGLLFLFPDIVSIIVNYNERLQKTADNSLLKAAYECSKTI